MGTQTVLKDQLGKGRDKQRRCRVRWLWGIHADPSKAEISTDTQTRGQRTSLIVVSNIRFRSQPAFPILNVLIEAPPQLPKLQDPSPTPHTSSIWPRVKQNETSEKLGGNARCPKTKVEARPQGIKKEQPQLLHPRRSTRLQRLQEQTISKAANTDPKCSTTRNAPSKEAEDRKRKRLREDESFHPPSSKRRRPPPPLEDTICENRVAEISEQFEEFRWPKEYSRPEPSMSYLLAIKKSSSSLRGKQSEVGSTGSDQKPREAKSSPYARPSYETLLATKGSFMGKFDLGITDTSKKLCQTLLDTKQPVPQQSLFRDDVFDETCEAVRARNEAMAVRDITPLICPSAQVLRIFGASHLKALNESVDERWNCARPICGPRPQPDYSVGFGRSAFTNTQLEKLAPFVGEVADTSTSIFMATWQMYFPFLTCEVKCGAAALDVADRQNAHSMTLAVRATVELFRLVNRERELHREILAFSISHDHETVRIYGHYPVIDGNETTCYRHPIRKFDFTELDGEKKWISYMFTTNVYNIWMPGHLKSICSVIDTLSPDIIEAWQQSELGESGLSQGKVKISRKEIQDANTKTIVSTDSKFVYNVDKTELILQMVENEQFCPGLYPVTISHDYKIRQRLSLTRHIKDNGTTIDLCSRYTKENIKYESKVPTEVD
ncbi:hypothetical protein G7Y89_g5746 [Cudoniella acicularis]|uniref:DUF7924 domain-containing protein n=1 Tax=Cudoniella acicularis TaxID=354080 RepID=A0A8H4RMP5_9HELO|nr:hypothetical protein G7Y89_g5746 [Cudoniella acicularis]